jgi:hypothetical protein
MLARLPTYCPQFLISVFDARKPGPPSSHFRWYERMSEDIRRERIVPHAATYRRELPVRLLSLPPHSFHSAAEIISCG